MDNIHAATKKELPATIHLINSVFIEWDKSTRMEEKFPIFLSEKNLEHIQIITDQGKPVSHVGYYQTKVIIQGAAAIQVGSIGSVCTHPAYRGKRLASQILDVVEAKAQREGIQVLLISGERSLYTRRQCIQVGGFVEFSLKGRQPLPAPDFELRTYLAEDTPEIYALYNQEPVRFYRSYEEFATLLKAGLLPFYWTNKLYVVKTNGHTVSYFFLGLAHEQPLWGEISEFAGDRSALSAAFNLVCQQEGLDHLVVRCASNDPLCAYLEHVSEESQRGKSADQVGTVKIINFTGLMKSLRSYFLQYVPRKTLNAIRWAETEGRFYLSCDGETVEIGDLTSLTQLIFGFSPGHSLSENMTVFLARHPQAGELIHAAFPVPLPWAGNLNFI
jgi:GNAT superfamily N-acetyltransferase